MANPFLAEIRAFPFNFAPTGWAFCNGQILPISQFTALFSLLGTMYGGDGKSNFALPNLQGNLANCQGQGAGLSNYFVGESGGVTTVTVMTQQMPVHNHNLVSVDNPRTEPPNSAAPGGAALASSAATNIYSTATSPIAQFSPGALTPAGGGLPHNNMMPYLTLNFCIAMQGVFPARS
ncbi:MAG: tail fiber protein [Bryobacteraceae bacterium]|jgi:microcystin-dependent protein